MIDEHRRRLVSKGMKRYWNGVKEGKSARHKKPKALFMIRVINQETKESRNFTYPQPYEPYKAKVKAKLNTVVIPPNFYRFSTKRDVDKVAYLLYNRLEGLMS